MVEESRALKKKIAHEFKTVLGRVGTWPHALKDVEVILIGIQCLRIFEDLGCKLSCDDQS